MNQLALSPNQAAQLRCVVKPIAKKLLAYATDHMGKDATQAQRIVDAAEFNFHLEARNGAIPCLVGLDPADTGDLAKIKACCAKYLRGLVYAERGEQIYRFNIREFERLFLAYANSKVPDGDPEWDFFEAIEDFILEDMKENVNCLAGMDVAYPENLQAVKRPCKSFLYSMLYRKTCKDIRAVKIRKNAQDCNQLQLATSNPGPLATLLKKAKAEQVRQTLSMLCPRDRFLLHSFHFAELSYQEMADALQISPKAIKSGVHRARKRFKRFWNDSQ